MALQNGIGIDDYLALCEEIGMVPAITIRLQYGGADEVQEAADWVEYLNGDSKATQWGKLRASRGHSEPYNVTYWSVTAPLSIQIQTQIQCLSWLVLMMLSISLFIYYLSVSAAKC